MSEVFIVYEFTDMMDSIWNNEERAKRRLEQLREENGPLFGFIEVYELNSVRGYKRHA